MIPKTPMIKRQVKAGSDETEQERVTELGKRRKLSTLYEINEEIGRGTYGVVKRVTHRDSRESFAAKFLPLSSRIRTRAFQERDLLSRLAHPNVAYLLDSFCTHRTLVLLMELCSSCDLLDHLVSKDVVTYKQVQMYIQQILEGIRFIHSMNLLHLDIKPANILMALSHQEEVKICDFGFCQEVDPSREQYSRFGTPEFVAPEIVCQAPVSEATDVWSLGILAFMCLTCRVPFWGENDRETLLHICEGRICWDSPDVTRMSCEAQDFLQQILQQDAKMRPSAAECLEHKWFQRSLTCYGSVMELQPIPELLQAPPQHTTLAIPIQQRYDSSSSESSGSSSEYDETDAWNNIYQHSQEEDWEDEQFYTEFSERRLIFDALSEMPENQGIVISPEQIILSSKLSPSEKQLAEKANLSCVPPEQSTELVCVDDALFLPVSDAEGCGVGGNRIPRQSVVKSTFYSHSQEVSPLSARRTVLSERKFGKAHERGRKHLRTSRSSRLNEPLIEYREDSAHTGITRNHRLDSFHLVPKAYSLDSGDTGPYSNMNQHKQQRRSKSLDEYMRMTSGPTEMSKSAEQDSTLVNDKDEAQRLEEGFTGSNTKDGVQLRPFLTRSKLSSNWEQSEGLPGVGISCKALETPQAFLSFDAQDEELRGYLDSSQHSSNVDDLEINRSENKFQVVVSAQAESTTGSQCSMAESSTIDLGTVKTSNREEPFVACGYVKSHHTDSGDEYENLHAPLMESSGYTLPYAILQASLDEEVELQDEKPEDEIKFLERSESTCKIPHRDKDLPEEPKTWREFQISAMKNRNTAQCHVPQNRCEAKPPTGKSGKSVLKHFFSKQSWSGQSSPPAEMRRKRSAERVYSSPQQQHKSENLLISKKLKESLSSFSKVMSWQRSKEDKKEADELLPRERQPQGVKGPRSHKQTTNNLSFKWPSSKKTKDFPLIPVESAEKEGHGPAGGAPCHTYDFLSEINRGRFSVVRQCQEKQSKQLFAAKITPYKQEQQQLVLQEYQLLKSLEHTHIVHLHAAFITPRYLVLIEELCAGRELLHNLADRDLYAEMHVRGLLQQILSAVEYLHYKHIVHLDLKSDNIVVTDQNVLKVVDLGSAQILTPGRTLSVEHIRETKESKVYIVLPKAPEILEGHGVGPETDIWAIGVLTFIMLSADNPFHSDLHWECERNIRNGKIQFGRCYPGLSEGAVSFMKSTLNNKPWARPSAADCRQIPWIQGIHQPSKHRDSIVCFSTEKLQAYLQERETKRQQVRTKVEVPLFD
ncbi:hypothetical protein AGOR_G00141340 [Albula goreensis]|uniref:Protein kinase domain-containing protein n=1 Tax=Albula goreensis TaxID=1534307 RepID=A0A8T3D597_9TELE|nr:hypothetical protein AGOR_G00141340 [Albula goreensis]